MTTLPEGLFSGLSALTELQLGSNELTTLPAGVFSGLTALSTLALDTNTIDPMPLTVTLEKVGSDQVRAKVLEGAPFAVDIRVTPANGTLAGDVTVLTVAAGSVESAAVTVTRTDGTSEAVTVDVDLSPQPSLPTGHSGYEFARAASGLPAEILPSETATAPTITAAGGDLDAAADLVGRVDAGHLRGGRDDRDLGDLQRGGDRHGRHGLRAERVGRQARAAGARLGHGDAGVRRLVRPAIPGAVGEPAFPRAGRIRRLRQGLGADGSLAWASSRRGRVITLDGRFG